MKSTEIGDNVVFFSRAQNKICNKIATIQSMLDTIGSCVFELYNVANKTKLLTSYQMFKMVARIPGIQSRKKNAHCHAINLHEYDRYHNVYGRVNVCVCVFVCVCGCMLCIIYILFAFHFV